MTLHPLKFNMQVCSVIIISSLGMCCLLAIDSLRRLLEIRYNIMVPDRYDQHGRDASALLRSLFQLSCNSLLHRKGI